MQVRRYLAGRGAYVKHRPEISPLCPRALTMADRHLLRKEQSFESSAAIKIWMDEIERLAKRQGLI